MKYLLLLLLLISPLTFADTVGQSMSTNYTQKDAVIILGSDNTIGDMKDTIKDMNSHGYSLINVSAGYANVYLAFHKGK